MVAPVLPEAALAPLRAMDAAGLTHTAVIQTWVPGAQGPGATYPSATWVSGPAQPARLNPRMATSPNLRADQPSAAGDWVLSLVSGSAVTAGQRVMVTGTANGVAWSRLLLVTMVLFPRSHELRRRCLCADVVTNP